MGQVDFVERRKRTTETENGLDWSGQNSVKCLFQCRTETKHTYSFTKLLAQPAFMSFLESVEVKGHMHI